MNGWCLTIAPMALVLSQVACTQAPPPAPPDTRAADEKTIRDMEAQWLANYRAKDADKLVSSYYADDASVLEPGIPMQTGRDAILKLYKEELADPMLAADESIARIEVSRSGDLAYLQGISTETHTDPKTKKPMIEKGKCCRV
jgi:ketosteroid isomerase-like protein